jgi:hypothetical protein
MAESSEHRTREILNLGAPQVFRFLSLPAEIRNAIYRMLLTTPYTYVDGDRISYFQRSPPIWLANKQLADEATKVLYDENEFVTVAMTAGPSALRSLSLPIFSDVPIFHNLRPEQIAKPVLKIRIDKQEENPGGSRTQINFVTGTQGIFQVIQAIWSVMMCSDLGDNKRYMSLKLDFQNKVSSRQKDFVHDVLDPWTQLHDIREVSLAGNISEGILSNLAQSITSVPQPENVTRWIGAHQCKIEDCLRRKDYPAARSMWRHLRSHWFYYHFLNRKLSSEAEVLQHALYTPVSSLVDCSLAVAKSYIHQQLYGGASQVVGWVLDLMACKHFKSLHHPLNPVLVAKYHLCCSLTRIVWRSASVFDSLNKAVTGMLQSKHYKNEDPGAMLNELYRSIGDYLSTLESPELEGIVFLEREAGVNEKPVQCRTFWEWLDVPED